MRGRVAERRVKIEPLNAPARPAAQHIPPVRFLVPGHQHGRSAVPLDQPGRHDPDDAGMPPGRGEHQGPMVRGQPGLGHRHGLVQDLVVQGLAAGVQRFELAGELGRLVGVVAPEQPEPVRGLPDPARGVQAGGENESHVAGPQRFPRETCRLHQRPEPGPVRIPEHLEAVADENAVLARERHHVGHSGEGDIVEEVQWEVGRDPQGRRHRLGKFERHARPAQRLLDRRTIRPLWIEDGGCPGERGTGQVVVGDNHLVSRRAHRGPRPLP